MSLFGKIFAILNVIAATGFMILAAMDWGQRERWAYAVFRHDLLVAGLPIDAKEEEPDGTPRVDRLAPNTLNAILPASTGTQVKTQSDEVKRVRGLVEAKVGGSDVPGTRSQKLARYLRALARTARERDDLTQKMSTPPAQDKEEALAAELQKQFDGQFDGVSESGADGKHSLGRRKDAAGRLLFLLGEALHEDPANDFFASPAYKRFVNVVGLTGAARAADDQALVVQGMTEEAVAAHEAELKQFVEDLDQAVYRAQGMSDAVQRQEQFLKQKLIEVANAKQLVEVRTEQLNDLRKQLADLQGKTAKSLAEQAKAEQEIMDRLIELRETARKNQELEREIRRLEGVPDRRGQGENTR
jgi:hypothetical protein